MRPTLAEKLAAKVKISGIFWILNAALAVVVLIVLAEIGLFQGQAHGVDPSVLLEDELGRFLAPR
jgi:hydrogenase/urease accessory protein HupE